MTDSNQNNENFPKILYKYLPLKDLTHLYYRNTNINTILSKNIIFFPDYRKLNDPSEGYTYGIIENDEKLNEHPLIKYLKLKFRILSLTKDCFSKSMWNLYAGGYVKNDYKIYEGICIGFKTNNEVFKEAKKIEYIDKEPKEINITKEFDKLKKYFEKDDISYEDEEYKNLVKALKERIKESFFYKYNDWEYEKEYRIVEERSFFIAGPKKQLEFELIKCILRENNLEELIKNISEVETTDTKEKKPICPYKDLKKFYEEFIHDISKDDKNKNSNEVINKIIEEIYKINEKFKKENNCHDVDFFKYSHEEIACLITGCDLEKKFTEINKKNTEHIQKYRDNFKNSFTKIFKKQKIKTKELINEKQIEEIGEKIDKLLSSNENNNDNYLKMLKNITDTMKNVYKYKKCNSYGIFIPFCSYKVEDKNNNKYEELRTHSPVINFDLDTINIQFFYMHELNLKNQIIEIYGNEEDADEVLTALSKPYGKHLILSYYHSILNNEYHEFSDFFNEKFSGKDIKDIEIKVKNIENYKNNPEKLEKDMKDFYKNHPEKLENIEEYSKKISKSINVLSKYEPTCEPKNDDPPSAFYFTFFISNYYNSLNLFFNNKTEKLEKLKELNKEFYENFKNKKFYKTIIGNGQIQLTNCINDKKIENQEELEKDIENQEELEKDIENQ